MRFAARWSLGLAALYAALAAVLVASTLRMVDASAESLALATAELLGAELTATLDGIALEEPDALGVPATRLELYGVLTRLAAATTLVEAVEVVDRQGVVAAATDATVIGSRRSAPELGAAGESTPRVQAQRRVGFGKIEPAVYLVETPIVRDGRVVAGVRFSLAREPFAELYRRAKVRLARLIVVVFALIAALALGLHLQWRRSRRRLRDAFDAAFEGRPVLDVPDDPLAPAVEEAARLGFALHDARERLEDLHRGIDLVGSVLEIGIVVLDSRGQVRAIGPQVQGLLSQQWPTERLVAEVWGQICSGQMRFGLVVGEEEIAVEGARASDGSVLVMLRRAAAVRALETDLRLAAQRRALMSLYRGLVHDLKAPLNALGLNLELLRRSIGGGGGADTPDQRQRLEVVGSEIERLRRGLELLLEQTAPPRPTTGAVDVKEVLGHLGLLLGPQARQQDVSFTLAAEGDGLEVEASADQLEQAILNLAVNALEAMPNGGALQLQARRLGTTIVVTVEDTGSGLPEAVQQRLFALHVTTKATGTGIGLYTSRAIVASLGGDLRLERTGPDGTTFALELPALD
jgi:signal transduction histidine kinase